MNPALCRPGTSDANIWQSVVDDDEYKLPQMGSEDVCIDIGANTGAATFAMLQKGAGKVIAFEPDPDNYILFRKQMKAEIKDGRVEIYPLAITGGSGFDWRTFSGVVQKDGEINHGGAYTFNKDGSDPFGYGQYFVGKPFTVPCIGFETIHLPKDMNMRLLKVDAEGAEWDIFMRSMSVEKFQTLVGEYHPMKPDQHLSLEKRLTNFDWKFQPHADSELGLFFAERK